MGQRQAFRNWGSALSPALLSGVAALHAWQFRFVSIDDAYITYRYADNIAHGLGYVFNPGQRVEGTSTFLFTLLLAIPGLLGLNIGWAARCIGIASLAALVWLVFDYVRATIHARLGYWLAVAASLMVASSTSLAFHAALGMELLLYISLLTAGVLGYLRHAKDIARCRHWMLWLALAGATRTEAFFIAFALLGFIATELAVGLVGARHGRAAALRLALTLYRPTRDLGAVLLPLLAFRRFYFRTWIPNSVTAKSGYFSEILALPFADVYKRISMDQGVKMLTEFGTERLGYLLLLIPLGWLSARYRRQTSVFVSVGAILTAVVIWNNGDWMPHARLLAPFIPLAGVAMATSIAQVGVWVKSKRVAASIQLIFAVTALAYGIDHSFYERTFTRVSNPVADYMIELGKALRTTHTSSEVLATDMAGRVPYFAGIRTIDMFGLCEPYIAHHGKPVLHMGKTDYAYVYNKRPDYYFYNFAFSVRGMIISRDFRSYANDYWVVMTPFAARPANRGGKVLLARKNLPRLAELVTVLNAKLVDPRVL